MSKPCAKHRIRSIVIILEPNHEQKLRCAFVSLQCHLCGQPVEFAGVEGPGVKLSADRRELRLDIIEAQKWMVQ
jgi:hypothetical protein